MNRSDGSLNPIVEYFLNRIKIRPYNISRAEGSLFGYPNILKCIEIRPYDINWATEPYFNDCKIP